MAVNLGCIMSDARALVRWIPPREREDFKAEAAKNAALASARTAEALARKARAERQERQHKIHEVAEKLVLGQLEKLLRLAEHPDFQSSAGPIEMKDLLKLAEMSQKEFRLDMGKSTANVAHAIGPTIDFAKMSPEERSEWRRLTLLGGGLDES